MIAHLLCTLHAQLSTSLQCIQSREQHFHSTVLHSHTYPSTAAEKSAGPSSTQRRGDGLVLCDICTEKQLVYLGYERVRDDTIHAPHQMYPTHVHPLNADRRHPQKWM
jgi:hypothetical protein